jgi:hypothetical protein
MKNCHVPYCLETSRNFCNPAFKAQSKLSTINSYADVPLALAISFTFFHHLVYIPATSNWLAGVLQMLKRVLLSTLIVLALTATSAQSDLSNGDAWNLHADEFNFVGYPMSPNLTALQAYEGSNFEADAAGIVGACSYELNRAIAPIKGNDLIWAKINGW